MQRIALLQAMDFALDPNGDGRIRDRVDIINMSLGSTYGQPFDDDLSLAVDNAAKVGVLTVASAGNSADKQFITGSPAAASSALSVAQTEVPSSTLQLMTMLAPVTGDRGAVFQPWSGAPDDAPSKDRSWSSPRKERWRSDVAAPTPPATISRLRRPDELAGQIVFVDRGTCAFWIKIQNIQPAGGILGIIGLVTPEAPFAGAFGGGTPPTIPGYMISQADGNLLRTGTASVRFDPTNQAVAGRLAGFDLLAWSALRRQHRQAGNRRAGCVDLRGLGQLHGRPRPSAAPPVRHRWSPARRPPEIGASVPVGA